MSSPADDPAGVAAAADLDLPVAVAADALPVDRDEAPIPPAPTDPGAVAIRARGGLYWVVSVTVIILDQITKAIVLARVSLGDGHTIITGLLDLVHVRNYGVAFGFLNESSVPFKKMVTTALAALALAGIGFYARHVRPEERLARVGLSLILGGALGNLLDRVRQGYVVDFVDVYALGWHFWAFNVADASITIGAILVFIDLLVVKRHASHSV